MGGHPQEGRVGWSEDLGLYPESAGKSLVDFGVVGDTHGSELHFEKLALGTGGGWTGRGQQWKAGQRPGSCGSSAELSGGRYHEEGEKRARTEATKCHPRAVILASHKV